MMLWCVIWIAVIILCIFGCVNLSHKALKWILGIIGSVLTVLLCFWIMIVYTLNWRVTDVDTDTSSDGTYEVILQQVGEPVFFGATDGRLVLKKDGRTIAKQDFTVYDDGAVLKENNWTVTWQEDYVEIIISGSEQTDQQYHLHFDGTTSSNQRHSIYEIASEKDEDQIPVMQLDHIGL